MAATVDPAHGTSPSVTLRRLAYSYRLTHVILAAAQLGLADCLAEGPRSAADLATLTQTDPRTLRRFLRVLVALGVLTEVTPDQFGLTPLGECLRGGVAGSQRDAVLFRGAEWWQRPWFGLLHSLKTGQPAAEQALGMGLWPYLAAQPDAARLFNAGMSAGKAEIVQALLRAYDFAPFRTIVDVGGGRGHLLFPILLAQPHLRGMLVDLPAVIEEARSASEAAGVAARCELVGGDFFAQVPSGGDAYLLADIIHDWDDERSLRILQRCREAIPTTGRLLLVERAMLAPRGLTGDAGADADVLDVVLMDLTMLVTLGGRERTGEEHRALLEAAGFRLARLLPLSAAATSILEAVPV